PAVYRLGQPLSTTLDPPRNHAGRAFPGRLRSHSPGMTAAPTPLDGKFIVLIGLMGAGKTSVGRRLAEKLDMEFTDADDEIVKAAGCSIEDIFDHYGEEAFRDVEERVISRLLEEAPRVLSTGGGAFMSPKIRALIAERCVSVWLRAELDVLVRRTRRRGGRPLLKNRDPKATLGKLIEERYPVYAEADIVVDSKGEGPDVTVELIAEALEALAHSAGKEARS
ncbi:MAG: shikimate kinase, partial [Rhodospirillales bacterium]